MRFRGFVALIIPFVCAALVLTTCAKPPTEAMEQAREAVSRAEGDPTVGTYAKNMLDSAKTALANMETEAAAKRYDAAANFAAEASSAAERAISDARSAQAKLKNDADSAVAAAQNALTQTGDLLAKARDQKNKALDLAALNKDFDAARNTIGEADSANKASRYKEAVDKAGQARSTLTGITTRVSQASIAANRKK